MRPRLLTVLVPGSMAVLLGVQLLLAALDGPRATAAGYFSVRLPSGWRVLTAPVLGAGGDRPDSGDMELAGPTDRRMQISWTDGAISYGFDITAQRQRRYPVSIGGGDATLTSWLTVDDFNGGARGSVAILDSVSHRVHGRTVSFAAFCAAGRSQGETYGAVVTDGWPWCIDILDSWRWETAS